MAVLTPGFWPSTFWPSNYWMADFWPEYGTGTSVTRKLVFTSPRPRPRVSFIFSDVNMRDTSPNVKFRDTSPNVRFK